MNKDEILEIVEKLKFGIEDIFFGVLTPEFVKSKNINGFSVSCAALLSTLAKFIVVGIEKEQWQEVIEGFAKHLLKMVESIEMDDKENEAQV